MTSASKARGSAFELGVLKYLREAGFDTERLRLAGKEDEGDLVVKDGAIHILECKATARLDLPGYLREAEVEAGNYAKHRNLDPAIVNGVAVIKRRNASIGQAYVVMTLDQYFSVNQKGK